MILIWYTITYISSCIDGKGNRNPLQYRVGHDWSDFAAAAAANCIELYCIEWRQWVQVRLVLLLITSRDPFVKSVLILINWLCWIKCSILWWRWENMSTVVNLKILLLSECFGLFMPKVSSKKKKKIMLMGGNWIFCTEDTIKFAVSKAERDVPERMTRVSVGASKPSDDNDSVEEAVEANPVRAS